MDDNNDLERPSKSARKREWQDRQRIVEQSLTLGRAALERLGIAEPMRDALQACAAMAASGARNRQIKHCAKLLDTDALTTLRNALDERHSQRDAANHRFHRLERWRDRLIADGDDALDALLREQPGLDRQHLRRLCREAARQQQADRPPVAARALFRYLKDRLSTTVDEPGEAG